MKVSVVSAWVSILSGLLALAHLVSLHFLSPEFDPSFRMISEYALGSHGAVLSGMFLTWALSTFVLLFAIAPQVKGIGGKIGLVFLVLAAVGMTMGGLFDLRTPQHGFAFMLGVPALPIAAILITKSLVRSKPWADHKKLLWWTAHATWISFLLMGIAMGVMFYTFAQSGAKMDTTPRVDAVFPKGVIAYVGWPNRILVVAYIVWVIKVAWLSLKLQKKK